MRHYLQGALGKVVVLGLHIGEYRGYAATLSLVRSYDLNNAVFGYLLRGRVALPATAFDAGSSFRVFHCI